MATPSKKLKAFYRLWFNPLTPHLKKQPKIPIKSSNSGINPQERLKIYLCKLFYLF